MSKLETYFPTFSRAFKRKSGTTAVRDPYLDAGPERTFTATVLVDGKKKRKKVKASNVAAARILLEDQGNQVTNLEEKISWQKIEVGKSVSDKVLLQVTRQLASYAGSGLSISTSLDLLAGFTKHRKMRQVLADMSRQLNEGSSLGQAARVQKSVFPGYYVSILDASERSGDLAKTFETLSSYLERDLTSKRAVKSALFYPALLLIMTIGAIVILSTTVLPKFASFFATLNTRLPLPTRMLMSLTSFVNNWWQVIVGVIALLLVGGVLYWRTNSGRLRIDSLILKIPVMGNIVKLISLERLTRILGSLVAAGVSLPDALQLAGDTLGNRKYSTAILRTSEGVMRGEGISAPMEDTKVFPADFVQMVKVGEQSGRFEEQLTHASEYYAKDVDYTLRNFTTLIEPFILLIVGGGVGFVAIALVSAMYGIYSSTSISAG